MKKLTALLILSVLLTNCRVHKNITSKKEIKDSTYTVERFIPVTYTVVIPGEEIKIHDTIPCPELEYHKEVTKNHLTARVSISKGKMSIECVADSLQKVIEAMNKEIYTYRQKETKETLVEEPKCHHVATKLDILTYIVTSVFFTGLFVWVYLKFKP